MAYQSINLFNGKTVQTFETVTDPQLETKIAAATAAFEKWRKTSYGERAKIVAKAGELMLLRIDDLARTMTLEMGSLASNGGEVEWFARDLLKVSTGDALKILNDDYQEIRDRDPGEFALMANAHALEEGCRQIVEEMIRKGGAKAIAVASSHGDGSERAFLDSPNAEWLWEFAAANDIVVYIHPPMLSVGHEVLMQYRLNEAVGRPFDSTANGARMIASGLFDRHPKLQVLVVHMGGELTSVLGRVEFNWHLNYKGIRNPPANKPYKNKRPPSNYFKTNILVDCMGFNPIGLRAAVEMCGVDRVAFGSDYGPIPYGIKEHVQIVKDVLPSPAERQLVFWKTSNRVFRLGLVDTDLITPTELSAVA
jgi:predicted TIM-barrel fold metal-dependent hydrolase